MVGKLAQERIANSVPAGHLLLVLLRKWVNLQAYWRLGSSEVICRDSVHSRVFI